MALTDLASLRTELAARGFDYLSDTRKTYFLNDGMQELAEMYPWPFLRTTATGVAPLAITDVGQVLSVYDSTNQCMLRSADGRDLETSTAGTPTYWYLEDTTLKVEPTNTTASLIVRYIKVPAELSATTDTPLFPARYRAMIVDAAQIRALSEDSDSPELAAGIQARLDAKVIRMRDALMSREYDSPSLIIASTQDF